MRIASYVFSNAVWLFPDLQMKYFGSEDIKELNGFICKMKTRTKTYLGSALISTTPMMHC